MLTFAVTSRKTASGHPYRTTHSVVKMSSRGIAVGLAKGFQITRVDKRQKVAANKGVRRRLVVLIELTAA